MGRMGRFLALYLGFSLSSWAADPSTASPLPSWEAVLTRLEQAFSEVKTVQARFVQEKELTIFQEKVILKGHMAMENPGRLVWHVEEPVRYAFLLGDKTLRQWDEDSRKIQEIALSNNPIFDVVDKQLRCWFSGQYKMLTQDYWVEVLQEEKPIRLSFVPLESSMIRKAIQRVEVEFREDMRYVQSIRIEDLNGDRTSFVFEETRLNEPIPPEEWEIAPREP